MYKYCLFLLLFSCRLLVAQNLITNGGFEATGTNSFGNGAFSFTGWDGTNYTYSGVGVTTTAPNEGTKCMSLGKGAKVETPAANRVAVTPGYVYRLSFDLKTTITSANYLGTHGFVLFYDANNVLIKTEFTQSLQDDATSFPWQTFTLNVVAPAGAVTAGVRVEALRGVYGSTEDTRSATIDNVKLEYLAEDFDRLYIRAAPSLIEPNKTSTLTIRYAAVNNANVVVTLKNGATTHATVSTPVSKGRGLLTVNVPVPNTATNSNAYTWNVSLNAKTVTKNNVILDQTEVGSTNILPSNAKISYMGRIDQANPNEPIVYWYGSQIITRFGGTSFTLQYSSKPNGYGGYVTTNILVSIDGGTPVAYTLPASASSSISLASGLANGIHTINIFKVDESASSYFYFKGIILDSGRGLLEPDRNNDVNIDIYGDSVTSGSDANPLTNGYAPTLARAMHGNANITSKGGTGVAGSFSNMTTLTAYWNKLNFTNAFDASTATPWNFSLFTPSIVFVGIGHNDQFNATQANFNTAYQNFISNLENQYPNAEIFCSVPLISYPYSFMAQAIKPLLATHPRVHFKMQYYKEANGSDGVHPSTAGHQAMTYGDALRWSTVDWIEEDLFTKNLGRGIGWPGTSSPVASISLSPTSATVNIGATQQLTTTILPTYATNQNITWASSNTAVATVSSTGVVSGVTAGTTTITATTQDGNKTATSNITVVNPVVSVSSVSISPSTFSLVIGATPTLVPTIMPTNATNQAVAWSSSNTAVATVSSSGLVTALSLGTATITVTTQDGSKAASIVITVVDGWKALNEPGSGGYMSSHGISPHNSNLMLLGGDMLGIGLSTNGGQTWQQTYGLKNWEIGDFTFHPTKPNVIWAGTMGGPYISTDGGLNWTEKRSGMPAAAGYYTAPIQKILFDPNNASHLLAFGGSHRQWGASVGSPKWNSVWESNDGGDTWAEKSVVTTAAASGVMNAAFAAGSSTTILSAISGKGIYKSTDGGATWTLSNSGIPTTNVFWVTAHPTNNSTFWASTGYYGSGTYQAGGVYKSIDGGATWTASSTGLNQTNSTNNTTTSSYHCVAVAPNNPNTLYTSDMSYWPYGIFKSTDGGQNWSIVYNSTKHAATVRAYTPAPVMPFLSIDPNDANTMLCANTEYALLTKNGGTTWEDVTSDNVTGSYFKGQGYSGLVSRQIKFNPYQANHAVILAMDDGKFWQSRDGMSSWIWGGTNMPHWSGGWDVAFSGTNGNTMYVTMGQFNDFNGVAKTTDGGITWTIFDNTKFPSAGRWSGEPVGVYALPSDANKAWVTAQGRIYATTDGGTTWSIAATVPSPKFIAAQKNTPQTFFVAASDGVYKTTDGITFTKMAGSPSPAEHLLIDPNDDNVLYATVWRNGSGGLWKYNGSTWTKLRNDDMIHNVAVQPGNSQFIVVTTNDQPYHDQSYATGVWFSTNGGSTWTQQNVGLGMIRGEAIAFNPFKTDELVLGTNGRGYFKTSVNVAVNSVAVSPTSAILDVNTSITLTATITPINANNKDVAWSSSNTTVATVSSTGVVTAITAGTATITVTTQDGNKTATSNITVTNPIVAVTGVTVSPTSATLNIGATQQLTAAIIPSNATNKTITWRSSNTSVATVSNTGVVTAVAAGTATITITTQDGSKIANSTITVTATTNLATNGTTYRWSKNTTSSSNSNRIVATGLNDNNLIVDVPLNGGADDNANAYEAAGVVWSTVRNNVNRFEFINGTYNSAQNGVFTANLALQSTTNGTTWTNVTGWTLSPAYAYNSASSGGVTYTFMGAAISGLRGVRIVGQVRTAGANSWQASVREVRAYSSSNGARIAAEPFQEINVELLRVYPNPSSGQLSIDIYHDGDSQEATIEIFDLSGRAVTTKTIQLKAGNNTEELFIQQKGILILSVNIQRKRLIKKIIIE